MQIECGNYSGFCTGVKYAVEKAEEALKSGETIYCLGEMVHNERVIQNLENKGMITVYDIEEIPNHTKVIFRAHGEPKEVYQRAEEKNLKVIDLTCGKIRVIRKKIEVEKNNSFIIIIGKKEHPETIGTLSFAGKNSFVIETEEDILEAYEKMQSTGFKRVYIVSQTTFSSSQFDELVRKIREKLKAIDSQIIVDKTICDATEKRQKEAEEIAKRVNKMVVIGGKHSSNTKELFQIAKKHCTDSIMVQSTEDLGDISFEKEDKIGIVAGASTPKELIDEIKSYIERNVS